MTDEPKDSSETSSFTETVQQHPLNAQDAHVSQTEPAHKNGATAAVAAGQIATPDNEPVQALELAVSIGSAGKEAEHADKDPYVSEISLPFCPPQKRRWRSIAGFSVIAASIGWIVGLCLAQMTPQTLPWCISFL
ncbi:MAG TPA: hypothetical protein V6C72_18725, partial [Chroococcales cyanobacterium]